MNGTDIGLELSAAFEEGGTEQLARKFFQFAFKPAVRITSRKFPDIDELTVETFVSDALDTVDNKLNQGECLRPFGLLLKVAEFSCLSEQTRQIEREKFYHTSEGYVPLDDHLDFSDISYEIANLFVEEARSDLEVDENIAVEIVLLAISQTSPTAQKVLKHILTTDPDYMIGSKFKLGNMSPNASSDLGMSRDAYRTAKSRAFKSLKQNILQIIKDYNLGQLVASESLVNIKRNFGDV